MKKYITLFVCILSALVSSSQCNTSIDEAENYCIVTHASEYIYSTEDRNQQIYSVFFAATIAGFNEPNFNINILHQNFFIGIVQKNSKELVVPRLVKFYFENGKICEIKAMKMLDSKDAEYEIAQMCEFEPEGMDILLLRELSILKVEVIDIRREQTITCNPYKDLIKEQINCVNDAFEPYFKSKNGTSEDMLKREFSSEKD